MRKRRDVSFVGVGVPDDPNDIPSRDDISFVGADGSVRPGVFSLLFSHTFFAQRKYAKTPFKREGISISLPS